ncbi:uncharacterized protein EI90DRAFT_3207525 [Cantharellus anzutake]|uniref:uncharacterized protein n=1 Tax=Cantharellus anzutake TaxID=1750568 RepID=UPI001904BDBE|nr:uncharacterized protein EI90DRAFT_3207525 [Cantharellus anzutake]KAF8342002.1 hypothetical protein EI90DRAFT_3207525 [Cantharellus anzutake]
MPPTRRSSQKLQAAQTRRRSSLRKGEQPAVSSDVEDDSPVSDSGRAKQKRTKVEAKASRPSREPVASQLASPPTPTSGQTLDIHTSHKALSTAQPSRSKSPPTLRTPDSTSLRGSSVATSMDPEPDQLGLELTTQQNNDLRAILSCIKHHLCFLLATTQAFPNEMEAYDLIGLANKAAQDRFPTYDHKLVQFGHIHQMMRDKPSVFRNTIKTLAKKYVDEEYKFSPQPCEENSALARALLSGTNFYFNEWRDTEKRRGRFRSPPFTKLIKHLYKDADWSLSWGTVIDADQDNVMQHLISFAATAMTADTGIKIEYVLNGYAGIQYDFTVTFYRDIYESHLRELNKWLKTQPNAAKVWEDICESYQHMRQKALSRNFLDQRIAFPICYETDDM